MKTGDKVYINNINHWAHDEWGIVKRIDNEEIHVALFNDNNSVLIFSKKELAKYNKPYNPTVYPY